MRSETAAVRVGRPVRSQRISKFPIFEQRQSNLASPRTARPHAGRDLFWCRRIVSLLDFRTVELWNIESELISVLGTFLRFCTKRVPTYNKTVPGSGMCQVGTMNRMGQGVRRSFYKQIKLGVTYRNTPLINDKSGVFMGALAGEFFPR